VGSESVISHDSALAVYQLSDVTPVEMHVTAPRSASRRRAGIRLHFQVLAKDEITTYEGLRLTTVERTIADVAARGLADEQVTLAIREALERGLTTKRRLAAQALRRRGRARHIIEKLTQ
jgi:predicted transcriptional regulator of viral defense system